MSRHLPGNPHAENALEHNSQVQATLALAYEQHTYNLIALARHSAEIGARESAGTFIEEVARRLGAAEEEDDEH